MLDKLERKAKRYKLTDAQISNEIRDLQHKLRRGFQTGKYSCASPIPKK